MTDFTPQIQQEYTQLVQRVNSIEEFLQSPEASEIGVEHVDLMRIQLHAMYTYMATLAARLSLLSEEK